MIKNKKLLYKVSEVAILAIVGCGLFVSEQANDTNESSFNLIFKYGVGARNVLNTFEQTYTKDMVIDSSITAELSLTKEELDTIYQKMTEIDFFDYPDTFSVVSDAEEIIGTITPYSSYYFKVEYDSNLKELWWNDNIFPDYDEEAHKLRELIKLIREIIESKEEYKNLPPPTGGYL